MGKLKKVIIAAVAAAALYFGYKEYKDYSLEQTQQRIARLEDPANACEKSSSTYQKQDAVYFRVLEQSIIEESSAYLGSFLSSEETYVKTVQYVFAPYVKKAPVNSVTYEASQVKKLNDYFSGFIARRNKILDSVSVNDNKLLHSAKETGTSLEELLGAYKTINQQQLQVTAQTTKVLNDDIEYLSTLIQFLKGLPPDKERTSIVKVADFFLQDRLAILQKGDYNRTRLENLGHIYRAYQSRNFAPIQSAEANCPIPLN